MVIYLVGSLISLILVISLTVYEYKTKTKWELKVGDLFSTIFLIVLSWIGVLLMAIALVVNCWDSTLLKKSNKKKDFNQELNKKYSKKNGARK